MRRPAASFIAALAFLACTPKGPTGTVDPDYVGSYALRTVASYQLPYAVLVKPGLTLQITADTIRLNADGSYYDHTYYYRVNGSLVDFPSDTLVGTWSTIGRSIKIESTKGATFLGNINGATMTIDPSGLPFVYTR